MLQLRHNKHANLYTHIHRTSYTHFFVVFHMFPSPPARPQQVSVSAFSVAAVAAGRPPHSRNARPCSSRCPTMRPPRPRHRRHCAPSASRRRRRSGRRPPPRRPHSPWRRNRRSWRCSMPVARCTWTKRCFWWAPRRVRWGGERACVPSFVYYVIGENAVSSVRVSARLR